MLSASNATLYLVALLLTSMAIFTILFFFRIDPLRGSVWLGLKQVHLPDGYLFVGHVAIFRADHRANFREGRLAEKFSYRSTFATRAAVRPPEPLLQRTGAPLATPYKSQNTKWSELGFSAVLGDRASEVRFERPILS
jgi:hypothetical protein